MKVTFVSLLLLVGFSAYADDAAIGTTVGVYEDNRIDTFHYRAPRAVYFGALNMQTPLTTSEKSSQDGSEINKSTTTKLSSIADLQYGITDVLLVGISEQYLFSHTRKYTDEVNNTSTSYSSSGLSDPTLTVNYRFTGGLTGNHFGNAYLEVVPVLFDEKFATSSSDGNNLAPAWTVRLGMTYYWVRGDHEFYVNPEINYVSSATYLPADSSSTRYIGDDNYTYSALGAYRYHISQRFYLSGHLQVVAPYDERYSYTTNTRSYNYPLGLIETVAFGWHMADDWTVSAAVANQTYTATVSPSNADGVTEKYQIDTFTLTAAHVF